MRCCSIVVARKVIVRECHGDLHLRNIVLTDGRPTLFDGIEFNDEIACTDVFYDLGFLLMDLWRRELPRHANTVLNTYVAETGDVEGLRLLPLFLASRSAVRAKTSATAAQLQQDLPRRAEQEATARNYLALAARLLDPHGACLVAIGGFSGSGKSTVARALAPSIGAVPGAIVVRSDEVRKRLCGVDPLTRLDVEGYSAEINRRVYDEIVQHAKRIVVTGQSVVADAVFARNDDRDAIEHAAKSAGVPFVGLWLDAPEDVLAARLAGVTRTPRMRIRSRPCPARPGRGRADLASTRRVGRAGRCRAGRSPRSGRRVERGIHGSQSQEPVRMPDE